MKKMCLVTFWTPCITRNLRITKMHWCVKTRGQRSEKSFLCRPTQRKKGRNFRDMDMKLRAKLKKNGSAARSDIKWPFYGNLRFVGDTVTEKRTFSNVPPITTEADVEEGPSAAGAARQNL